MTGIRPNSGRWSGIFYLHMLFFNHKRVQCPTFFNEFVFAAGYFIVTCAKCSSITLLKGIQSVQCLYLRCAYLLSHKSLKKRCILGYVPRTCNVRYSRLFLKNVLDIPELSLWIQKICFVHMFTCSPNLLSNFCIFGYAIDYDNCISKIYSLSTCTKHAYCFSAQLRIHDWELTDCD